MFNTGMNRMILAKLATGLGCIFCLVVSLGLLLSTLHSRRIIHTRLPPCPANMGGKEGAKSMWMLEQKKSEHDIPTEDDLKSYLKNGVFPVCPNGGTYSINAVNVRATCSVDSPVVATNR